MRGQHLLDGGAQPQVGAADDAGADARRPIDAARRHRRDAVDELGLADRPQRLPTVRAVHGQALHEHGGRDVVAAALDVGDEFVEQIAPARPVPQMVMGVDDRQLRLQCRLAVAGEPIRAHREIVAGGVGCARHAVSLVPIVVV
jgi:hypothetical protein